MLLATALVCALLAGNAMLKSRSPNWIHILGFAAITTITMYVILDLEYPRRGLIQVDALDQMLKDAVK
jgi:NhaP-type Na+/H+ and K+/H+ antiporter